MYNFARHRSKQIPTYFTFIYTIYIYCYIFMPFNFLRILKGTCNEHLCRACHIIQLCLFILYIYTSHCYNIFMSFVYTRFRMGLPPSPPSALRYPPTPLDIFFGFKWPYMARCVLRLSFYRGGVKRVTAGRFCANFGYFIAAAAVKIAAACFWSV